MLSEKEAFELLKKLDKKRAEVLNENDQYRVKRALEIIKEKKIKPSGIKQVFCPVLNSSILAIFLTPELSEIKVKIQKRLNEMLKEGLWQKEVELLLNKKEWKYFFESNKAIGYKEVFELVKGKKSLDDAEKNILRETFFYAKRQLCFYRGLKKLLQNINFSKKIGLLDSKIQSEFEIIQETKRFVGIE